MFPGVHAARTPDKPAIIAPATGETVTYRQLDENSTRIAHFLRDTLGLVAGEVIAMVTDNDLRAFDVYWAALRSGMYVTAINHHLTAPETNFILDDCGAKALFASANVAAAVAESDSIDGLATDGGPNRRVAWGGSIPGFADYDEVLAAASDEPLADQPRGTDMLYSSGTTGRPKGIKPPLPQGQVDEVPDLVSAVFGPVYGFGPDTVYLSPAPVYHAAPLRYCAMVNALGGTTILMDRFDPEPALRLIQEYGVTHSQWVPTMFVRMLKLPPEVRERYDVSSMQAAIHAAAPCPTEVKRAMIDWWGPVVNEYYAATEAAGVCLIGSEDALTRPGSVGKAALGIVHICDENGDEVPVGGVGTIYFERDAVPFVYHNDPEKTRKSQHPLHETWATTGDLGYVDEDGFLYLTDRTAFTIIVGGVNVYPQESENILINHPAVYDVAVLGVPDEELGEQVKACVQLAEGYEPSDELAAELIAYTRESLAAFKTPRTVDFLDELPRTPTGKMVKGELRKRYG
ncbi:MAG TPA: acyl-CoA synthetase [Gordonia sp. (in: high G+C Gram-positive bacteria)]|uniref:acyl-CoA synthetase n=1 Tax=unclassified Gordonia (in: high G+C Gram-positive bacteria) TaxID=2657482 RepID=UPI000F96AEB6|nr:MULTISPECIES: acyl-CoA synthetase [unclassified Gordonia (in: high G+C Gram-positive bacteria)]RUP35373.1 MAG: acyl-CoA synthetase [Gordonia sp. (in: high G+C Gram-positive bacteria)]HNP55794.1 acyl-CoA synthetase [Gordonia sp. (in: high G+C Gram-positive bacteria)]HRC52466.1 acyl-CoA synthetase [Gordonia sp. (in: high G+C Gram-positive bacteria)]